MTSSHTLCVCEVITKKSVCENNDNDKIEIRAFITEKFHKASWTIMNYTYY